MPVLYGTLEYDPATEPTPIMASAEAAEVSAINEQLWALAGRIDKFTDTHYGHVHCAARDRDRCAFCKAYPHVIDFLNLMCVGFDMQAEFLMDCRPPTTAEFLEQKDGPAPFVREAK